MPTWWGRRGSPVARGRGWQTCQGGSVASPGAPAMHGPCQACCGPHRGGRGQEGEDEKHRIPRSRLLRGSVWEAWGGQGSQSLGCGRAPARAQREPLPGGGQSGLAGEDASLLLDALDTALCPPPCITPPRRNVPPSPPPASRLFHIRLSGRSCRMSSGQRNQKHMGWIPQGRRSGKETARVGTGRPQGGGTWL